MILTHFVLFSFLNGASQTGSPTPPNPPGQRFPPNHGYPVSYRSFAFGDMAKREWGQEWGIPDVVYEMHKGDDSAGRKFESSDMSETGIYKKR